MQPSYAGLAWSWGLPMIFEVEARTFPHRLQSPLLVLTLQSTASNAGLMPREAIYEILSRADELGLPEPDIDKRL